MYRRIIALAILLIGVLSLSFTFKTYDFKEEKYIKVEIKGEIVKDEILTLPIGSSVKDALDKVKLNDSADLSNISLLKILRNNEIITIPRKNENILISINSADSNTLQSIPGIGEKLAQRIVEYRTSNGSFISIDDLKEVNGIGEKKFESIKKYICL